VNSSTETSALEFVEEGNRARRAGDWSLAEKVYREATSVDAHCTEAWEELGCLMQDGRRFPEAIQCFRHAIKSDDPVGPTDQDERQTAIQLLNKIAAVRQFWARGQFCLGSSYEHTGDYSRARIHLGNAARLDSSLKAAIQALIARMYWMEEKWTEAIAAADLALAANPSYFLAWVIRAKCCAKLGRMDEACENNRCAVAIHPHAIIHSDLVFDMNYLSSTTPEAIFDEARRWNALYAQPLASKIRPHTNSRDAERRLTIGYVSPDLYRHPMHKFLPPVLEHHDRSHFEVFLYAVGSRFDGETEAVRGLVDNFVFMPRPDSRELANRIRADGVDILVDLAGHTMGSAHLALALKPAPVQVSWIGALSTTGMSTMDYFLGDPYLPCPGTEHLFTERIYRLPHVVCCYRPHFGDIPVAPAPCLERGYITFGCFNNPQKITREVAKLWAAILHLVPDSRLLLKYRGLEIEVMQQRFRDWFAADGIVPERLQFAGATPPAQYLAEYGRIDIALDPFPYNGGSTTLDALWMGVPVVTLAGRLAVQCDGKTVLNAAGMSDLVAGTPEEYLKIALFLAGTVSQIPDLRHNVRHALQSSPLMDEAGLVKNVEDAYREMWRQWCR
jgi:protein O-GlcNAc transferase